MENDCWTRDCCSRHLGLWAVEPFWLQEAWSLMKAGLYPIKSHTHTEVADPYVVALGPQDLTSNSQPQAVIDNRRPYQMDGPLAVIPITGPLVKGGGKNGEVDSLSVRRAIRAAVRDEDVSGIMLVVDSPGGTVAGTEELATDVRLARESKPVFAHIEDLGASAAYWVASQAGKVTASSTSEVGSIGTMAVVEDLSGAAKAEGIRVHVIATGGFKGAFVPGVEIPEDHLAYLQERVNALNEHFLAAVSKGRGQPPKTVEGWADGRVWIANKAKDLGLIDGVMRFDRAMDIARRSVPKRTARTKIAQMKLRIVDRI